MKSTYLTVIVTAALLATACGTENPKRELGVTTMFAPSTFTPVPPIEPSGWSRDNETPAVSPNGCDCLPGYTPVWGGVNWVCARGTDREMPYKNAYCNVNRVR